MVIALVNFDPSLKFIFKGWITGVFFYISGEGIPVVRGASILYNRVSSSDCHVCSTAVVLQLYELT